MLNNLYDFFLETMDLFSNKILFKEIDENIEHSYGDVKKYVILFSLYIQKNLSNRKSLLLLHLNNTPFFFKSFVSVILSGNIPVIIDPQSSADFIKKVIIDYNIKGLLTHSIEMSESIEKSYKNLFVLHENCISEKLKNIELSYPERISNDSAYIIFSSGTTGNPKAVQISSENMLFEINSMNDAYKLKNILNHLCVLPMYHSSALYRSILIPFINGSCIFLSNKFDKNRFWEWIEKYEIGFVQVVPTILYSLLNNSKDIRSGIKDKLLFIGSASSSHPVDLIKKFEEKFHIKIAQGYGLTEATCAVTLNHPDSRLSKHIGSVGKPIEGVKVKIVDENNNELSPNKTGEIIVSGNNIIKNYYNADIEDGKRFVNNFLFTEDIGYLDEDGYLFIIGRKSDIIQRGGFNISPAEIENMLMSHPDITNAVVFGVYNELLGEDLIAYVSTSNNSSNFEYEIRKYLSEKLPLYKIPSRILSKEIEQLSKGIKINRKYFKNLYCEKYNKQNDELKRKINIISPNVRAFKFNKTVYLRPLMYEDIQSKIYLDNIMNPDVQFFTYSGRFPQSEMEIRKYWENVRLPDAMNFAICDSETHKYVGNIALRIEWIPRLGEFGRLIFKEFQDKSYSHEAMKLLMEYAFDDLKLNKLYGGGCNPSSIPSLIKLGFTIEGKLRKHHFLKGDWRDQFMVGILSLEYDELKNNNFIVKNKIKKNRISSEKLLNELKEVIQNAFFFSKSDINEDTSPSEVKNWDSLGIVVLKALLEDKFNISLSSSDMLNISNIGDIAVLLETKL